MVLIPRSNVSTINFIEILLKEKWKLKFDHYNVHVCNTTLYTRFTNIHWAKQSSRQFLALVGVFRIGRSIYFQGQITYPIYFWCCQRTKKYLYLYAKKKTKQKTTITVLAAIMSSIFATRRLHRYTLLILRETFKFLYLHVFLNLWSTWIFLTPLHNFTFMWLAILNPYKLLYFSQVK